MSENDYVLIWTMQETKKTSIMSY